MKKFLTSLGACILFVQVFSQAVSDSLFSVWTNSKTSIEDRTSAFEEYIKSAHLFIDPDTTLILINQLEEFSLTNEYQLGIARSQKLYGLRHRMIGNLDSAIFYYQKSLLIGEELDNRTWIAALKNNIGEALWKKGDLFKANQLYEQSSRINIELGNYEHASITYMNWGVMFKEIGLVKEALKYYDQGLIWAKEAGNKMTEGDLLLNYGLIHFEEGSPEIALDYYKKVEIIYKNIKDNRKRIALKLNKGGAYSELGQTDQAIKVFKDCIQLCDSSGIRDHKFEALHALGGVYANIGDTINAITYLDEALNFSKEIEYVRGCIVAYNSLGKLYFQKEDYIKAEEYCKKSFFTIPETVWLPQGEKSCECLYGVYRETNNHDSAYLYLDRLHSIQRKIDQNKSELRLKSSLVKFRVNEEREKQEIIRNAEKKENRNTIIWIAAIVFLVGIFMVGRMILLKKSKIEIEREKKRSDDLLLNILPEHIATELKKTNKVIPKHHDEVTVLFTDFENFTRLSQSIPPDKLVAELNSCFSAFDSIARKYAVEKIKTIGDSYMVAGGLTNPGIDAVTRTIYAAMEMNEFMVKRNAERLLNDQFYLPMRLGIHTGSVTAGVVGTWKFQYDIWGDTVNTAHRIESHGTIGKMNISHSTYSLISSMTEFVFSSREEIEVKGKGRMKMYFVDKIVT
ncbi:MAG: adenylate/guanylate cyclase domain-containing protein [Bacteroidota bacterium]